MYNKYKGQDISARLNGTICRYKKQAVYVCVQNEEIIDLYPITYPRTGDGKRIARISPDDRDLDISTPPMGYVNFDVSCYYLVRTPVRRYKQGIDQSNVQFLSFPGEPLRNMRHGASLFSKEVEEMFKNTYPSFEQVIGRLRSGNYASQAVSRDVAFRIDSIGMVSTYYQNALVGHILPNSRIIQVPESQHAYIVSRYLSEYGLEIV